MSTSVPTGNAFSLEGQLSRFEEQWFRGPRPALEDYLEGCPEELREQLLIELTHADLELCLRKGEPARVEDYLNRFPELSKHPAVLVDLLVTEYRHRSRRHESGLSVEEYRSRFPNLLDELGKKLGNVSTVAFLQPVIPPPDSRPCPPGYEVLERLGKGGMGVVYKARQLSCDRLVALKMMLRGGEEAEVLRFRREAETLRQLTHPGIVQLHDFGEHLGQPFFAMELVAGGTLDGALAGTPLQPEDAARLVKAVAEAIHAAHRAGVIHRDLKPRNIFLTPSGAIKVGDFGLAKSLAEDSRHTPSGMILGTPSYMAPEQAAGQREQIGPATDVYALGAILYECLTGQPPFRGGTPAETIAQVLHDPVLPIREQHPDLPRELETICGKCLERSAGRRYATAADLAEDLARFIQKEPIKARPVGVFVGIWTRLRESTGMAKQGAIDRPRHTPGLPFEMLWEVFQRLDQSGQDVLQLWLEGYSEAEIAKELLASDLVVAETLKGIRGMLEACLRWVREWEWKS